MQDILDGYSKALYSTWFYYKPARLLLDSGEGIIHALGKKIFGIRKIFLTHGHEDHIAGLPSLVNLRNLSNGDREIPISIYYPGGDPFIKYLREYLDKKQRHRLRYALNWTALRPEDHVDVEIARRPTRVAAFAVDHTRGWQSLGYRIEERRQVLREEFAGTNPKGVKDLLLSRGRDAVLETVWHPILVYTGDTRPIREPGPLAGADVLLIDSTFLDEAEMAESHHSHSHIEASFETAAKAGVRHLVLMHLSGRYGKQEIREAIDRAAAKHGRPPKLGYFFAGRYFPLPGAEDGGD